MIKFSFEYHSRYQTYELLKRNFVYRYGIIAFNLSAALVVNNKKII